MQESVSKIAHHIKNIAKLISPILNTEFKMQNKYGDENLREVESSKSGLWLSYICINAKTRQHNSEKERTHTIIKFLYQRLEMN